MRSSIIMPVGTIVGSVTSVLPVQTFADSITDLFISGTVTVNVIRASANTLKYDALDVGSAQRIIQQINKAMSGGGGLISIVDTPSPAIPSGLAATAKTLEIDLGWTYAVPAASQYNVYRSTTSGGPYALIGSSTTNFYNDVGLTVVQEYFYVITSVLNGLESAYSAEVGTTPSAPPTPTFASVTPDTMASSSTTPFALAGTGLSFINQIKLDNSLGNPPYIVPPFTVVPSSVSSTEIDFTVPSGALFPSYFTVYYSIDNGTTWTTTGLTIHTT